MGSVQLDLFHFQLYPMDLQLIHELLHILDRCERSIVRGHAQPRSPSLFPSHFFHGQQDSPWFHRFLPKSATIEHQYHPANRRKHFVHDEVLE